MLKSFRICSLCLLLLLGVAVTSHSTILTISQPTNDTGLPIGGSGYAVDSWAWQSFTVNTVSTITSFGLVTNGGQTSTLTATMDLYFGEGIGGAQLSSKVGSVINVDIGGGNYTDVFAANFGISLNPGQYTVYIHDVIDPVGGGSLNIGGVLATEPYSYAGGKFVSSYFGDSGYDAQFFTPIPNYSGGASSVPEPGTIVLMGSGFFGMLGFRRRENLLAFFKR